MAPHHVMRMVHAQTWRQLGAALRTLDACGFRCHVQAGVDVAAVLTALTSKDRADKCSRSATNHSPPVTEC